MQLLAFDTTALTASVALWRDGNILSEISSTNALNHSVRLLPMIDEVFSLSDSSLEETDAFAVSAGPGSFTGVRIGISTMKALAFGTDKLCAPVSALEALALNEYGTSGIICAVMDARRSEFYNALFSSGEDGDLIRLTEDRAISAQNLAADLKQYDLPITVCGDGAAIFYQHCKSQNLSLNIRLSIPSRRVQRAASVAQLGAKMLQEGLGVDARTLAPLYLRASGAERKRNEETD